MPRQKAILANEEKSKTTKPVNKNAKSLTAKTHPKSSQSQSTISKQTKRKVGNATNSNNTQAWNDVDVNGVERKSIAEFIKMHVLMHKYTKYSLSEKGRATSFVKKHLKQATNKVWVEVIEIEAPKHYEIGYMQFKTVVCELYPRTIQPQYPPKSQYPDKDDYKSVCNAIDWETAQKDIRAQKRKGIIGTRYRIEGVIILNKEDIPPMFIKSAPDNVKALANDIKDKSSSAWEEAYKYLNPEYMDYDPYQYKIRKIERLE